MVVQDLDSGEHSDNDVKIRILFIELQCKYNLFMFVSQGAGEGVHASCGSCSEGVMSHFFYFVVVIFLGVGNILSLLLSLYTSSYNIFKICMKMFAMELFSCFFFNKSEDVGCNATLWSTYGILDIKLLVLLK